MEHGEYTEQQLWQGALITVTKARIQQLEYFQKSGEFPESRFRNQLRKARRQLREYETLYPQAAPIAMSIEFTDAHANQEKKQDEQNQKKSDMEQLTTIYLIRHGETYDNKERRLAGRSKTLLTPMGIDQAREVGRRLRDRGITATFASTLPRAIQTAQEAFPDMIPAIVEGLEERSWGPYIENTNPKRELVEDELEKRLPYLRRSLNHLSEEQLKDIALYPGMETDRQTYRRMIGSLNQIARQYPGEKLAVFSHGDAIRVVAIETGLTTKTEAQSGTMLNGGHIKLVTDGKRVWVDPTDTEGYQPRRGHKPIDNTDMVLGYFLRRSNK